MNLNILIIEDENAIQEMWEESIDMYHVDESPVFNIIPTYCNSLSAAKKLLSNSFYDAAVIDIRLKNEDGTPNNENDDGNEIFDYLTKSSLSITAIYTGEPGIADDHHIQKNISQIFTKGDGAIQEILSWIDNKKSLISSMKDIKYSFDREMAKCFSRSVWPRWEYWLDKDVIEVNIDSALKRHMATHLHATFLNENNNKVHPEEYYFIPPLRESLDTGDIIFDGDSYEILITPRCDIAQNKSDTYQFVKLVDKSKEWKDLEDKISEAKDSGKLAKVEKAVQNMSRFTNHDSKSSTHFIQKIRFIDVKGDVIEAGPFVASFSNLRSAPKTISSEKMFITKRIASLSNEFVPSLVERLGGYFSRIGSPDYSHPQ